MPELAFRSAGDPARPAVLLVHGYPASSFMWGPALHALAARGLYALAPDLPGYGDSEPDPPGTWERHVEALERFRSELGLDDVVLVVHDWGVMVGLRWACDPPGTARALVISDGGFFADRRWHDLANTMRTPGEGEKLMEAFTREGFEAMMGQVSSGIGEDAVDEYWKAFATTELRMRQLELYRSGDFEKLEPYEGCVAGLGVPALVVWGAQDPFSGVKMGRPFHEDIDGSELLVLEEAGHFVWEDEPEATSRAVVDFLRRRMS